ncbi:hypothetical protein CIPAW_10G008400 [Carya illinoinensis]|uniref:RNase H type-1 domain-containing protein n=1 Tax=Carya illinoinensis TaxID=32201 RepID=A0A8T1P8K5_CARIL|nr:hypothetical protein CIPAW_10G008400 [Carya illinoinensis]
MNTTHVEVETDSKLVAQWWDKGGTVPWRCQAYWKQAKTMASSMVIQISQSFRVTNHVATKLAKLGSSSKEVFFESTHSLPKDILGAVRMDKVGSHIFRQK